MSAAPLVTRRLLGAGALMYFYRRRLRAHGVQELLAGVGIAAAVALVLAASVTQDSITSSTRRVVGAVTGPANLQVHARSSNGFPESLLARVEAVPGVKRAAPLLEATLHVTGPNGGSADVYVAGTDVSLGVLNGLGQTLPLDALTPGEVGLSVASAHALGVDASGGPAARTVTVIIGGRRRPMRVSAVLGGETVGALSGALVGVMPLASLQRLLGMEGRVSRVLVQSDPGAARQVRAGLERVAGPRLIVSGTGQDVALLSQALKSSGQASALFAVIGALVGFLFAFNAILLTVPERRQVIADLRLSGTRRSAIVQLVLFQAVCLGVLASAGGVIVGYALARWVFHQSTGYLSGAFTIGGGTVLEARSVLIAGFGGVIVTCVASALPLADLRDGRPPDGIYVSREGGGGALAKRTLIILSAFTLALLALAGVLYASAPSRALLACAALALATVLAVPVVFAAVLAGSHAASERAPHLSTLAIALGGVRGTTVRALALAATGAVALFGSVALGGARANLLSGIRGFSHSYAADAPIWVGEPGDNQATKQLAASGATAAVIRGLAGVASVQSFQGAFLTFGPRRVWVLARGPGGAHDVLGTQTTGGTHAAENADRLLARGGWVTVSQQIADEHHASVGASITLPTPSGPVAFRVAALTSNLAWSPGAVIMSSRDFTRDWGTAAASALAVTPAPNASEAMVAREVRSALGPASGLEVASAARREANINVLTSEGLSQLGMISTLLILAAILALAAALASSIHQRRHTLAGLRLAGATPARLRRILLVEACLMLGAGCVTGALAGVLGQFVIDRYLREVTGFPVADAGASARPVMIFAIVLAAVLAVVAAPAWGASRVSPALALVEE